MEKLTDLTAHELCNLHDKVILELRRRAAVAEAEAAVISQTLGEKGSLKTLAQLAILVAGALL